MTDMYQRVTDERDIFKQLLSKVPGFKGYVERETRRSSDKLLRDSIANQFEGYWQRISSIQKDLVNEGQIEFVDDMEGASIKLRQFIDRVKTASYGYAGLFDAIKIDQEELSEIYRFDLALLNLGDEVNHAIDNVEASIGSDGLKAAIKNLINLSQQCVDTFNKRVEVIKTGVSSGDITPTQPAQ